MSTWEEEEETRRSIELLEAIWASASSGSTTDINSWGGTVTTLGQKVKAQSVPVTLASDQGTLDVNVVSGTISVGAVTVNNGAGAAAVNIQDGGNSITIDGSVTIAALPNEGQQTMANSISVAIASDQSALPISISGTIAATQSGTWNINNVSGTISLPTGAATAANQLPDGHNVTVDNAAGVAAVNIQDGGNSITVDGSVSITGTASISGTVAATQSGTWNINNVSGTISLPTGAATAANQATEITSLQLLDDAVATTGSAITTKGFAASGTDGTNARILKTDTNGELQIDVLTSALPTGAATLAEQQTQTASLSVLDDWDESDRAKVNTKVGAGTPSVSSVTTIGTTAALALTSEPCAFLEISGTYGGISITFEARAIGGSTYQGIKGWDLFSSIWGSSTAVFSNAQRRFYFNTEGFDSIRCRVLSFTSGTMDTRWIPVNTNSPIVQAEIIGVISAVIASTNFTDSFGNSGPGDGVQIGFQDQVLGDYQRQHGSTNAAWVTLMDQAGNSADVATETTLDNMRDKIVATGASSQVVQGPSAVGASVTTGNLFPCGFKDLFNNGVIPTGLDASGVIVMGVLPLDVNLNIQDFSVDGAIYGRVASTDDTTTNAKFIKCDSSGVISANPTTGNGKTLTYVPVNQGAAGTTVLAAALASNKHKIVGCSLTMSAAGSLKFLDGSGDLTGPMDIGATGGFVWPTSVIPYQQTATNSALSITTTTGAAKGVVIILTEA